MVSSVKMLQLPKQLLAEFRAVADVLFSKGLMLSGVGTSIDEQRRAVISALAKGSPVFQRLIPFSLDSLR